jgi:topoisomerase-4 subunit A
VRLTEIKIKRISRFDSFKADEEIRAIEDALTETEKNLRNLTKFTIRWYESLREKYGKGRDRRTEVSGFDRVDRTQVVAATETLFVDRKNGFAGWGLKKEEAVEKCSRLDDLIAFSLDGKMVVQRLAEKSFVGKRPVHVAVLRKDEDPVYSMIYRDGRDGAIYAKRFKAGGITRDKEYDLTLGTPGTRVLYFAVHANETQSAENLVMIHLKPALRLRNVSRPFLFGEIALKGRAVKGNMITRHPVDRVVRAPREAEESGG